MSNLSSSVLEKIKTENITPIPRWQFLLRGYVIWATFIISLFVGALGFSISLFLITHNDLLTSHFDGLNLIQTILIAVPIFWLLLTGFFVTLAYYNFKHTNKGYRYGVLGIFVINLLISVVLGFGLYLTGVSATLNSIFNDSIPYYNQVADLRDQVWMRPEQGYLSGDILSIISKNSAISIKDLNGINWNVNIENALIRPSANINVGSRIKILGTQLDATNFQASEIRPWSGMMTGSNMMDGNGNDKGNSNSNGGHSSGK